MRLTFNKADDVRPAWSPNGQQIVFHSYRDDARRPEIYVMDADGSDQRRLTHHPGTDAYADWSPDGSQIAFTSSRNHDENHALNIFVMDADGNNVRQVTNVGFAQRPKWSPDGQWILFMEGDIFAIRPDGTDLWQVSQPKPETWMHLGGWSPDGKQILYVEAINGLVTASTPIIATLAPGGRAEVISWKQVKIPLKALDSESFSADGKSILFKGKRDFVEEEPWNIYRFGLVDKQLTQLTDSPRTDSAAQEWNPLLSVPPQQGLLLLFWGAIKSK